LRLFTNDDDTQLTTPPVCIVHAGFPDTPWTKEFVSNAYPFTTDVAVDVSDVYKYVTLAVALFSVMVDDTKLENETLKGFESNLSVSDVKVDDVTVAVDVDDRVIDDVSKEEADDVRSPFTVMVELCTRAPAANPI